MSDGKLSVKLTGEAPRGWKKDVEGILALLSRGAGSWGSIRVGKDSIEVSDVREGAEEDLRQLLEGALLQANSDLGLEDEPAADASGSSDREQERRAAADARAADAFRAFASTPKAN